MEYVIIIAAIIIGLIWNALDEGSVTVKLILAAVIVIIACLLLKWITGWDFLITLAKIGGVAIVLITLFNIIGKLFSDK